MKYLTSRLIMLAVWITCVGASILLFAYMFLLIFISGKTGTLKNRFWNIALLLDDAGNEGLGGQWMHSISNKCAIAAGRGKWWGKMACWIFDSVNPGHCQNALKGIQNGK